MEKHNLADPRLVAGAVGWCVVWREVARVLPLAARATGRSFVSKEDAEEAMERREGLAWTPQKAAALRAQYARALLDRMVDLATAHVSERWRLLVQTKIMRLALRHARRQDPRAARRLMQTAERYLLVPEEAEQLLRETEQRLAEILPDREAIFRLRLGVCPLCDRAFLRPTQARAQKYCPRCRKQWSPKQRWSRTRKPTPQEESVQ